MALFLRITVTNPPLLQDRYSDASGGLIYHLRALAHRTGLWAPFHAAVASWLADWQPPQRELVLVGPSAGYSLPRAWLERFTTITALEPDPLARHLLRRRVTGSALHFACLDCLATEDGLAHLAHAYPDAAILFCNIIGQIEAPHGRRWAALFDEHLGGHAWASYHDAISTRMPPVKYPPEIRTAAIATLPDVLAHFWAGGELPLIDHDSFRLGGARPHRYALWQISTTRWHLVEWVSAASGPAG